MFVHLSFSNKEKNIAKKIMQSFISNSSDAANLENDFYRSS